MYQLASDGGGETARAEYAQFLYDAQQTDGRKFWGGDLAGLLTKVDEIADAGFSAIWISPHILQATTHDGKETAYHYYWGKDWFLLDPHLTNEGEKDFALWRKVVAAFHQRDIKIIIDLVFNHTNPTPQLHHGPKPFTFSENGRLERNGELIATFDQPTEIFAPTYSPQQMGKLMEYCHHYGDYSPNQCTDIFAPIYHLPEINLFNHQVLEYLQDAIAFWLDMGVDGIRLDTVRNLPPDKLAQLIKFAQNHYHDIHPNGEELILMGEYFGAGEYDVTVADYLQRMSMAIPLRTFDFSYAWEIRNFFGHRGSADYPQGNPLQALLGAKLNQLLGQSYASSMYRFFDNHDNPLLIHNTMRENFHHGQDPSNTTIDGVGATNQALTLLLVGNGIPVLYYATISHTPPPCFPHNQYAEGECSRPMLKNPHEPLINNKNTAHIISTFSRLRRPVIHGKTNPAYLPLMIYGEITPLQINQENPKLIEISGQQERRKILEKDLYLGFEKCWQDQCLVYVTSINFSPDAQGLFFIPSKPGTYQDLLTQKTYQLATKTPLHLANYQSLVLLPITGE